jgi:hypothetical protein
MKNFIFICGFTLLLSSCNVMVDYIGDKYPPSNSVDVYYSAHDVTKAFKVIGHMNIPNVGQDQAKASFIKYAKSIGADAIVITGANSTKDAQTAVINADALKYN